MFAYMCHGIYVEVRGQFVEVDSFFPPGPEDELRSLGPSLSLFCLWYKYDRGLVGGQLWEEGRALRDKVVASSAVLEYRATAFSVTYVGVMKAITYSSQRRVGVCSCSLAEHRNRVRGMMKKRGCKRPLFTQENLCID